MFLFIYEHLKNGWSSIKLLNSFFGHSAKTNFAKFLQRFITDASAASDIGSIDWQTILSFFLSSSRLAINNSRHTSVRRKLSLHDSESLFQFDHQLPVALLQVVAVVILARVDRRAADLKWKESIDQTSSGCDSVGRAVASYTRGPRGSNPKPWITSLLNKKLIHFVNKFYNYFAKQPNFLLKVEGICQSGIICCELLWTNTIMKFSPIT